MRWMSKLASLLLLILFCISCENKTEKSDFISKIFLEKPEFRNISIGDSYQKVKKTETAKLKFDDDLGLVYTINLGENTDCELEYYFEKKQLVSIILNIVFLDEISAQKHYDEIFDFLLNKHPNFNGKYGDYFWKIYSKNTQINLKLFNKKKYITLNYSEL